MNPDGTINSTLWEDFAERSLHEMALKTKALTAAYYLQAQKFAYWDGCSTGGRQGYKIIQNHADDYNGYLVGAPAFNWTKFITAELYPQIVYQRDLGGVALTTAQQQQVSAKAVSACDVVGGQHLRLHPQSRSMHVRPGARRATALVHRARSAPAASSAPTRRRLSVIPAQAQAQNKIWFGQTPDGSVPDPLANNGYNANLTSNQLWYGYPDPRRQQRPGRRNPVRDLVRYDGARVAGPDDRDAGLHATPVANGLNHWQSLTYGQLANAQAQGVALQPFFGNINTDSADLSGCSRRSRRQDPAVPRQRRRADSDAELGQLLHQRRQPRRRLRQDAGLRPAVPDRRHGPLQRRRHAAGNGGREPAGDHRELGAAAGDGSSCSRS